MKSIGMACTHTEMPKFADPEDGRFKDSWDQLDWVTDNAIASAQRTGAVTEEARFAELSALAAPTTEPS